MAYNKESIKSVVIVALSVCLVCALVVSVAAIALKPQQVANKLADRNQNILSVAGLFKPGVTPTSEIPALFKKFTVRVADLEEKRFLTPEEAKSAGIDVTRYNQRAAAKNPDTSIVLTRAEDIASIRRRARYSVVYVLDNPDGSIDRVVLPVHGYGLWSTMYGFIALEGDLNTVAGLTFYEQAETAGLGGEIENPRWRALWNGKTIYNDVHDVVLRVIKGHVDPKSPDAIHEVDGISGATLTSRGVQHLVQYWLGQEGFGPILSSMRSDTGAG